MRAAAACLREMLALRLASSAAASSTISCCSAAFSAASFSCQQPRGACRSAIFWRSCAHALPFSARAPRCALRVLLQQIRVRRRRSLRPFAVLSFLFLGAVFGSSALVSASVRAAARPAFPLCRYLSWLRRLCGRLTGHLGDDGIQIKFIGIRYIAEHIFQRFQIHIVFSIHVHFPLIALCVRREAPQTAAQPPRWMRSAS